MKSKFKVLFLPGTHAGTCDRVVIFFFRSTILRSSFEKNSQSFSDYPPLNVLDAHICENMDNTLKIKD